MQLIPLHDGRPGLRTQLQVETRSPTESEIANQKSKIENPDILDFISSTATLDRYHEIIDPSGWRLDSYLRNPVFRNAHQYGDILFTLGKALITEVRTSPRASDARVPGVERHISPRPSDGRGAGGEGTPHSAPPTPHLFQRVQFAT